MPQCTARWRWSSSTRTRTPGRTTASASTTAPSSARAVRDGIIDPERSIQIGIRTHAPEDYGIEHPLRRRRRGDERADAIADAICAGSAIGPAYLTFDIDCLDPAYAPGTGTPVAGGPTRAPRCCRCCGKLGALDIKGADIVEVSPRLRPRRHHRDRRRNGRDVHARPTGREADRRAETATLLESSNSSCNCLT